MTLCDRWETDDWHSPDFFLPLFRGKNRSGYDDERLPSLFRLTHNHTDMKPCGVQRKYNQVFPYRHLHGLIPFIQKQYHII